MITKIPTDAIVTYSGRVIRPLDPDPEDICIEDIAHSLSNQCRFTGHTTRFYSVAQHSVLVSEVCDWDYALWGLLHDATEAYLSDIARPLKLDGDLGKTYRYAEMLLAEAVADKFGLPMNLPNSVLWADDVLLRAEMSQLMPPVIQGALPDVDEYDQIITPLSPAFAKHEFLTRYHYLRRNV